VKAANWWRLGISDGGRHPGLVHPPDYSYCRPQGYVIPSDLSASQHARAHDEKVITNLPDNWPESEGRAP